MCVRWKEKCRCLPAIGHASAAAAFWSAHHCFRLYLFCSSLSFHHFEWKKRKNVCVLDNPMHSQLDTVHCEEDKDVPGDLYSVRPQIDNTLKFYFIRKKNAARREPGMTHTAVSVTKAKPFFAGVSHLNTREKNSNRLTAYLSLNDTRRTTSTPQPKQSFHFSLFSPVRDTPNPFRDTFFFVGFVFACFSVALETFIATNKWLHINIGINIEYMAQALV